MALLTKEQTAEELGVLVATLDRWRWNGIGPPFVRLPKGVRYHPDDVQQYIKDNRRIPAVQAFMEETDVRKKERR